MSLIDKIKQILQSNKKNAQIYCQTLQKTYQHKEPLEIGIYDNKKPITDTDINITINGNTYTRKTDQDGIAKLNINLLPNTYRATIDFENETYNHVTTYCDVIVKSDTRIDGINLTKNEGDSTPYQCAVYDMNNNRIKDEVTITINGVPYTRTADNEGLYKLNINLNPGTYQLKASYNGNMIYNPSTINNTITINPKPPEPKPEPEPHPPEPQKSRNVKLLEEFETYFGKCEYIDDAMEKIQGRGYSFYFSDGYNMSETIRRIAHYEGANCFDSAEVFYHIAKGMNEKYGRKYEVQYLDVWCPVSGYDHIRLRLRSNGGDWFYRDPSACLDGNSITYNWCSSGEILEVNPSWIYDGD